MKLDNIVVHVHGEKPWRRRAALIALAISMFSASPGDATPHFKIQHADMRTSLQYSSNGQFRLAPALNEVKGTWGFSRTIKTAWGERILRDVQRDAEYELGRQLRKKVKKGIRDIFTPSLKPSSQAVQKTRSHAPSLLSAITDTVLPRNNTVSHEDRFAYLTWITQGQSEIRADEFPFILEPLDNEAYDKHADDVVSLGTNLYALARYQGHPLVMMMAMDAMRSTLDGRESLALLRVTNAVERGGMQWPDPNNASTIKAWVYHTLEALNRDGFLDGSVRYQRGIMNLVDDYTRTMERTIGDSDALLAYARMNLDHPDTLDRLAWLSGERNIPAADELQMYAINEAVDHPADAVVYESPMYSGEVKM